MNMSDSFNHLESIWYQSEPLEVPYCPKNYESKFQKKDLLADFWV